MTKGKPATSIAHKGAVAGANDISRIFENDPQANFVDFIHVNEEAINTSRSWPPARLSERRPGAGEIEAEA